MFWGGKKEPHDVRETVSCFLGALARTHPRKRHEPPPATVELGFRGGHEKKKTTPSVGTYFYTMSSMFKRRKDGFVAQYARIPQNAPRNSLSIARRAERGGVISSSRR